MHGSEKLQYITWEVVLQGGRAVQGAARPGRAWPDNVPCQFLWLPRGFKGHAAAQLVRELVLWDAGPSGEVCTVSLNHLTLPPVTAAMRDLTCVHDLAWKDHETHEPDQP